MLMGLATEMAGSTQAVSGVGWSRQQVAVRLDKVVVVHSAQAARQPLQGRPRADRGAWCYFCTRGRDLPFCNSLFLAPTSAFTHSVSNFYLFSTCTGPAQMP